MVDDIRAYEHPFLTADVVVMTIGASEQSNYRKLPKKRMEVLLVERAAEPFRGMWSLPGGFVNPGQTARDAAVSKLAEKTGVDDVYLEQLYTFSAPDRDPRGWVVSCSHLALIEKGMVSRQSLEPGARWFAADLRLVRETCDYLDRGRVVRYVYELSLVCGDEDLPEPVCLATQVEHVVTTASGHYEERFDVMGGGALAFDHAKQVAYAILRMRNKIEYTDLALNMMPELFTLTELQNVYEAILGRELLKAAFRRTVSDMVVESGEMTSAAGHRPSRLYRRNWSHQVG